MSKKLLLGTVAAAAFTLGMASAKAADITPEPVMEPAAWYVSLFGGASWLEDFDTDYTYQGYHAKANVQTDTGFIVGGAIGTHLFSDDVRAEIEGAYSEYDADKRHFDKPPTGSFNIDGSIDVVTIMANLWYDIPLSEEFRPYLGGGAGVAFVDGDVRYAGDGTIFNSTETEFAFQLGAGLRWAVSEHLALDVGYRFRGIDGPTFGNSDFPGSSDYHSDWLYSSSVIGGISYGF